MALLFWAGAGAFSFASLLALRRRPARGLAALAVLAAAIAVRRYMVAEWVPAIVGYAAAGAAAAEIGLILRELVERYGKNTARHGKHGRRRHRKHGHEHPPEA